MYDDTLIKWITIEINELPIVESLADNVILHFGI